MKRFYRYYVLALLVLLYLLNFIDRNIIIALSPYIKSDLHVTDAQLGLLVGTTFALFYALMGLPLAKLADGWNRVWSLAVGLTLWSIMTCLSGLTFSFSALAGARVGVGVGEATTGPAAVSLLGDYFEKEKRATILSIFAGAIYVGSTIAMAVGGFLLGWWGRIFPDGSAPLGLTAWQGAFFIVGAPGIVLALLMLLTVKEPVRGGLEGIPTASDPRPFSSALQEIAAMIPPWSMLRLRRIGGSGPFRTNIAIAIVVIAVSALIVWISGGNLKNNSGPALWIGSISISSNTVQWTAMGFAVYALLSWFQTVQLRDPEAKELVAGSRAFRMLLVVTAFNLLVFYSMNAFVFVYANRYLGFGAEQAFTLGIVGAAMGVIGVVGGGIAGDFFKRLHPAGRVYFMIASYSGYALLTFVQFSMTNPTWFGIAFAACAFVGASFNGCNAATAQDLVVPRLRGTAYALQALCGNLVGLGLGPYTVGLISDLTGNLRAALFAVLATAIVVPLGLKYVAARLSESSSGHPTSQRERVPTGVAAAAAPLLYPTSRDA
jgi:MFS family permease